jgi:hypothetical protein
MNEAQRDVALFRYSLIRVRPNSTYRGLCRARDYAEPGTRRLRPTWWRAGGPLRSSA